MPATSSPQLTIFSCPRHFWGESGVIQRQAISTWTKLPCVREIILFGDEYGTDRVAREVGARHIPKVIANQFDTPLLDYIFEQAQTTAQTRFLCYVASDTLLMASIAQAFEKCVEKFNSFVMFSERLQLPKSQDCFQALNDAALIKQFARRDSSRADFFLFDKNQYQVIPPFALGKGAWDNWLAFDALARQQPLIKIEDPISCLHLEHDYAHTKWADQTAMQASPEWKTNYEFSNLAETQNFISSSSWVYRAGCIEQQANMQVLMQIEKVNELAHNVKLKQTSQLYSSLNECMQRGWNTMALYRAKQLNSLMPGLPGLHLIQGKLHMELGQFSQALAALKQELAHSQFNQQVSAAIDFCEKAIAS